MTLLDAASWPSIPNPAAAVVVPLGSTEQHGRHLPFDVDTTVAAELSRRLVSRRPTFVLAPALAYGASGEHQGFPAPCPSGPRPRNSSSSNWAGPPPGGPSGC